MNSIALSELKPIRVNRARVVQFQDMIGQNVITASEKQIIFFGTNIVVMYFQAMIYHVRNTPRGRKRIHGDKICLVNNIVFIGIWIWFAMTSHLDYQNIDYKVRFQIISEEMCENIKSECEFEIELKAKIELLNLH